MLDVTGSKLFRQRVFFEVTNFIKHMIEYCVGMPSQCRPYLEYATSTVTCDRCHYIK